MNPIKKCILSLNEKGELVVVELDEEEEGMFYV